MRSYAAQRRPAQVNALGGNCQTYGRGLNYLHDLPERQVRGQSQRVTKKGCGFPRGGTWSMRRRCAQIRFHVVVDCFRSDSNYMFRSELIDRIILLLRPDIYSFRKKNSLLFVIFVLCPSYSERYVGFPRRGVLVAARMTMGRSGRGLAPNHIVTNSRTDLFQCCLRRLHCAAARPRRTTSLVA